MKKKITIIYLYLFCFICVSNISCQTKWQGKKITLPKISKEIISMRKNDQKYRMKYVKLNAEGKTNTQKFEDVVSKLIEIDRSNTRRMEEIVDEYGWPTFEKVGEEASNAAWLIVQHADRNPFFQEKCLLLMKSELQKNQINKSNYAYLYDRVQLAKGQKQLYATQSTKNHNIYAKTAGFQPIEDESNIQKRRDEMNIAQHVEHYALSLNFNYSIPTKQEAIERAIAFERAYINNIEKAEKAMISKNYNKASDAYMQALNFDGYTKPKDYVEAARAISLSKRKEVGIAGFYLLRAVFMGYENVTELDTNPDFDYLKNKARDFWENDLIQAIKKSTLKKSAYTKNSN